MDKKSHSVWLPSLKPSSAGSLQPHRQRARGRAHSPHWPLQLLKLELPGEAGALAPAPASPFTGNMSAHEPSQATLESLQGQTWRRSRREGAPGKDASMGSRDCGAQAHMCRCLQDGQIVHVFKRSWNSGFLCEMS